jgi:hypothetical protein
MSNGNTPDQTNLMPVEEPGTDRGCIRLIRRCNDDHWERLCSPAWNGAGVDLPGKVGAGLHSTSECDLPSPATRQIDHY